MSNQAGPRKLIELRRVTKTFGGVVALDEVDFEVFENEIVALLGDNGAGKSTLIKVISGAHIPDSGDIFIEGNKAQIRNPIDAMGYGIETIYQDLALFDNLSAAANLYIGKEATFGGLGKVLGWMRKKEMEKRTAETLDRLGLQLRLGNAVVRRLSGGQRQGIAIGRALMWGRKLVVLDEPTAALGVRESANLLAVIRNLAKMVKGVVIISHNMDHVIDIADRAIVLRRGRRVGDIKVDKQGSRERLHNEIVSMITGKQS